MSNIVYVLTNPAMPGLVKIGMTDRADVQSRMNNLYTTGVPLPFECIIARQIEDKEAAEIENALHTAFGPYRISPSREFFGIDTEQVEVLLRLMTGQDVTPRASEQNVGLQPDIEAASEFKKRQTLTNEIEFLESLDENGRAVHEQILALGKQDGMKVNWGSKGFSLNVVSNRALVVVCYGYPPHCVYKQSLYTDFASMSRKSNVPQDVVEDLKNETLSTGLFVSAGGELRCRIDRRLEEAELTAMNRWLISVVDRIREFEAADLDKG